MGYLLDETGFSHLIENLKKSYRIFAPVLKKGQGRHLDTDVVLYDEVNEAGEIGDSVFFHREGDQACRYR